ncbi:FAD-dependent oxidoreductase [Effusibacillus lacus]|uniref:FAD-dependent oxidoreductase n=1 Tax=Effusibacillus lacus TaxID=1348429 RepID=A0A292YBU4_9BACL|nr:NAD-dependent epimerase/dehydratase family protein [Effusibacillus lacus]GAX88462.1 FAD-dependent oxidoreductase [Effusibacillus lacus]
MSVLVTGRAGYIGNHTVAELLASGEDVTVLDNRSTEKRIREGFIEPTLKEAVPGDLGLVLSYNTMKSLIEMMEALDRVTPGIASEHTLFYGVEAKFYSARPKLTDKFETEIQGLFTVGDGAGITRGLAPRLRLQVCMWRGIFVGSKLPLDLKALSHLRMCFFCMK